MSGAAIYIKRDMKVSDVKIEILVGIFNLYSLIGSCLAGRTSDWIGRRYTIVLAGAIFFVGAILMGFSPNYAFLMFGRFVAGVGMGYALMVAPVYTAELAPPSSRGFLTSFTDVCLFVCCFIYIFFFSKEITYACEVKHANPIHAKCRCLSMWGYCSGTYPTTHFQR